MKLNTRDNREIDEIIKNLQEDDFENISNEVERLEQFSNPIFEAFENFKRDEFTAEAMEWFESDSDFHDLIDECSSKVLRYRVTREYAIGVFVAKHRTQEAA